MDSNKFRELGEEDVRRYTSPDWCHFIGSVFPQRPGVALFSTILEHKFFPPGTPKNEEFQLATIRWVNDSVWFISSVPITYFMHAEATAKFAGISLKKDLFPVMNDGPVSVLASVSRESWETEIKKLPGMQIFPLYLGVNMYTMENSKDHPIYKNMSSEEIMEGERKMIDDIIKEDEKERGIKFDQEDWDELEKWRKYMFGKKED